MTIPLGRMPAAERQGHEVTEAPRSFEGFFDETHQRLFGGLCLVTGDRHEAEEIMQDAYLKLWERWDRVARMEDPAGYLFRTALNLFRSRYRRAGLALRRTASLAPRSNDTLAEVEDRDEVVRMLRDLGPAERASIVVTTMFGYSSEEAGLMLGLKPATVRAYASRARAGARARMEERS
jgi:RNA polymerase sigma-70 factor (ECF subfamily)